MASPTAYDQLGIAHLTLGKNPDASIKVFESGLEDVHRRGTEESRLTMELRFHLTLAHLESRQFERARKIWWELERRCAASKDPSLGGLLAGWRRDLERHYPALYSP